MSGSMRPSKEVRGLLGQIVISVEVFQGDEEAIQVKGIKETERGGAPCLLGESWRGP